jgi:hypothetical protein
MPRVGIRSFRFPLCQRMDEQRRMQKRSISRDELYTLVWQTPMNRLGAEFGITGNGLAKICDRLAVPYPPGGHWAKKEAGKAVVTIKLPARPNGVSDWVDIHPTPPKLEPSTEIQASAKAVTASIGKVTIPETLDDLHPKVKAWLTQHKQEQKKRNEENRRHKRELWGWSNPPLEDLTKRDLYRFRVTSAIFKTVEKAGGKIEDAPITGKVTFLVSGQKVECSIVEKLIRPLMRPEGAAAKWTAYPDHHQSGLHSSGFLRVGITTYLPGKQPQWIETLDKKIAYWLPEIVGAIIAAGPVLAEQQREREESARRYREEEARRYERQRLKEIDTRRWTRLRERAVHWEERTRLLAFITEVQRRSEAEGDTQAGDRQLSEWITWAQEKINALDPFSQGLIGLFESISC